MAKRNTCILILMLSIIYLFGCNKIKMLDELPSTDLSALQTLEELKKLLANTLVMNRTPCLGDISSDNYYINTPFWNMLPHTQRNACLWKSNIYENDKEIEDYKISYHQVLICNIVLEKLSAIEVNSTNQTEWSEVKGSALFFRAHAFHQLSQIFAVPYNKGTAEHDLGIPLRLSSSMAEPSTRATIAQTYGRIVGDLKEAEKLLGPLDASKINLPSQPAAHALLSRVYVSMGQYDSALKYAQNCLRLYDVLQDYNQINVTVSNPFKNGNAEILFRSEMVTSASCLKAMYPEGALIDTTLFRSYHENDLRKKAFFLTNNAGAAYHKFSYSGTIYHFTGLAIDEVYLTRAECLARTGQVAQGMNDINNVLRRRYKSGTFTDLTAANENDALTIILQERRKELLFRGSLRWTDLRRLNKEGKKITLRRVLDGHEYSLDPNGSRYVLPFPYDVISMTGMPQNPR